jgi:hypothetical protein
LAEVLITIGIIGIVAAITLPTLMTKIKQARYRAAFKKGVATLNQAVKMNYANYGWDFSGINTACDKGDGISRNPASVQSLCSLLLGSLTGVTETGYAEYPDKTYDDFYYKFTPQGYPNSALGSAGYYTTFLLPNGMILGFKRGWLLNDSCRNKDFSTNNLYEDPCIGFIDVNGISAPNKELVCAEATKSRVFYASDYEDCTLGSDIGDVVPILFYDQTVVPVTNSARALFGMSSVKKASASTGSANSYASGSADSYASGSADSYVSGSADSYVSSSANSYTCNYTGK